MSSRFDSIVFLLIAILASGNSFARVDTDDVCPKYSNAKIKSIGIFDGKPEELVALAPDDEPNEYFTTLGYIYEEGHTITIRCNYDTGFIFDVELKEKVDYCMALENKEEGMNLICK